MYEPEQIRTVGLITSQILLSLCSFRILQYAIRWYLFGKWSFPTFFNFSPFSNPWCSPTNNLDNDDDDDDDEEDEDERQSKPVPNELSANKKWRISNEAVSLLHAVMSGLWAIAICVIYGQEMVADTFNWYRPSATFLILMTTGYLFNDLIDLIINEHSLRTLELFFHHITVFMAFATTISGLFQAIVIFALIMEVNSIFLHFRSLLNIYHFSKMTAIYRTVSLLNLFTLFVCRLTVSVYLVVWQLMNCWSLSWYYTTSTFLVVLSMTITNVVLAYRLLAADGYFDKKCRRNPQLDSAPRSLHNAKDGVVLVPVDLES